MANMHVVYRVLITCRIWIDAWTALKVDTLRGAAQAPIAVTEA